MELVLPLLCLCVLSCSGSTSAAGAEPERINVTEGQDVILPCSTTGDITSKRFEWKKDGQMEVYVFDGTPLKGQHDQFKGRVSHFPGELTTGNASITIRNTMVADTGTYTCKFPRLDQTVLINLLVGAAARPSVKTVKATRTWALLQCDVFDAFPEPAVEWKDSEGKVVSAEAPNSTYINGRYNVVLQANVTRSDNYTCVVTQKEISHQDSSTTDLLLYGPEPKSSNTWIIAIVVFVIGLVLGVCGLLVVQRCRC